MITHGSGAGTADRQAASGKLKTITHALFSTGHMGHDVEPFNMAYTLDGGSFGSNVYKYIEVRPAINAADAPTNP